MKHNNKTVHTFTSKKSSLWNGIQKCLHCSQDIPTNGKHVFILLQTRKQLQ
ncbi:hypothetical protein Hanom_Chr08g00686391 [Helianthus anomalus]